MFRRLISNKYLLQLHGDVIVREGVPGLASTGYGAGRRVVLKRAAMGWMQGCELPGSSKVWGPLSSSCNAKPNSWLLLQSLVGRLGPEESRAPVAALTPGEDQGTS